MRRYYIENEIIKLPVKKEWADETHEERVARVTVEMRARFRRLKRRARRKCRNSALVKLPNGIKPPQCKTYWRFSREVTP